MGLEKEVVVRAEMMIRKPVAEVFEAFINPEITTKFWFTKSSGKLEENKSVDWEWEMYGVGGRVYVKAVKKNRRLLFEWPTPVEILFSSLTEDMTEVKVVCSGFSGTDNEIVAQALDSMGGFSLVLAACKIYLEHGISPNIIGDHRPASWKKANG